MPHGEPYGSGPALDKYFDFIIGPTGDLLDYDGLDELEKDLAFASAFLLDEYTGEPLTPTTERKIKNKLEGLFSDEPRISSLRSLTVTETDYGFEVQAKVIASDERQEIVYPVGEHE